jgi:hypothetical protein
MFIVKEVCAFTAGVLILSLLSLFSILNCFMKEFISSSILLFSAINCDL